MKKTINYNTIYEKPNKSKLLEEKPTQEIMNQRFVKDVWAKKYSQNKYNINALAKIISDNILSIEDKYPNPTNKKDIIRLLLDFKYLMPGGSVLFGLGSNEPVSISNCFVIPSPEDSYGGIMMTDQHAAQIMKRRGGVGLDLSKIRPVNSKVCNSAISSTGIVPFADRFSRTTQEVAQDGRRGE